jgi:hypothetical protein
MVSSAADSVEAYLAGLPEERREVVSALRELVNAHLPEGYREAMAWGMIGWAVPLSRYPDTYNGQPLSYAALAAQKNGYSLYLMGVYADAAQLRRLQAAAAAEGKRLDMGKSCLRFKRLDQLPLDAIAAAIAAHPVDRFIALHEAAHAGRRSAGATAKRTTTASAKTPAPKNAVAKKAVAKKAVAKASTAKTSASNTRTSTSAGRAKVAAKQASTKTSAK